jgi:hypothetical protein
MANNLEFNGFKIYPVGKAKLSIEDRVLRVSEISDSGLDGILIDTNGKGKYTINFGELATISENKGVLKTSTLEKNGLGQVITSFESFKWYDEKLDQILLGYNLDYLPKEFVVFGRLNGEKVFDIDSSDLRPINNRAQVLIDPVTVTVVIAVVSIGVAIWAALRTKKSVSITTHYDNQGHIVGYSRTITEDPVPFEVEVNGEIYTVDEVGIKYDEQVAENLIGNPAVEYTTIAEQITGVNLHSFEITSIELDK